MRTWCPLSSLLRRGETHLVNYSVNRTVLNAFSLPQKLRGRQPWRGSRGTAARTHPVRFVHQPAAGSRHAVNLILTELQTHGHNTHLHLIRLKLSVRFCINNCLQNSILYTFLSVIICSIETNKLNTMVTLYNNMSYYVCSEYPIGPHSRYQETVKTALENCIQCAPKIYRR